MTAKVALGGVLATLLAANLLGDRLVPGASRAVSLGMVAVLAAAARAADLGLDDVGLARRSWSRGARFGAASAVVVATGYAVGIAVARARGIHLGTGERAAATWTRGLVLVPLFTVLPEEFAFRGVLWGLGRRSWGPVAATALSSGAFGVWHVLPSLGGGAANNAAGSVLGDGPLGVMLRAIGTVLLTGAAGVVLCELRRRSGSLVAPVLTHWAINGLGLVAVHLL